MLSAAHGEVLVFQDGVYFRMAESELLDLEFPEYVSLVVRPSGESLAFHAPENEIGVEIDGVLRVLSVLELEDLLKEALRSQGVDPSECVGTVEGLWNKVDNGENRPSVWASLLGFVRRVGGRRRR